MGQCSERAHNKQELHLNNSHNFPSQSLEKCIQFCLLSHFIPDYTYIYIYMYIYIFLLLLLLLFKIYVYVSMVSYLQSSWVAFSFSTLLLLSLKGWMSPKLSPCHLLTGRLLWFKAHLTGRVGRLPPTWISQISPKTCAGQWEVSLGVSLYSSLWVIEWKREREKRRGETIGIPPFPPEETRLYVKIKYPLNAKLWNVCLGENCH